MTAQQNVPTTLSQSFVDPFESYNPLGIYDPNDPKYSHSDGLPRAFSWLFGDIDAKEKATDINLQNQAYERASIESARAWSEYMDNTEVQRHVKDIEAAGLNPWLAVQNGISGSGAPTVDTGGSAQHSQSSGQSTGILRGLLMLIAGIAMKNPKVAAAGGASMTGKQMPYIMTKGHK